ncbi:MAG: futalosine hydrolase [Pirellulaceae bacterium]|nr:futalosine hydrolase [Pirellulaceae bacterium]
MLDVSSTTLWLMPTDFERQRFLSRWRRYFPERSLPSIKLCGFGPIAAGVVTAQWLAHERPSEVVLLGIGGTFDPIVAPVGTAVEIGQITTDTVGAQRRGQATLAAGAWELPGELGFPQVPMGLELPEGSLSAAVSQDLDLGVAAGVRLLTVGVASGSRATALARRERFPGVLVEDMEGFAVALACRLVGVRCLIFRGLTNEVGDREFANWRIDEALDSLAQLVVRK